MIEILISLLVLSIGLLGLAGLQAASLDSNSDAHFRSVAVNQAYDMADRIQANRTGYDAGVYASISGIGSAKDCESAACTASSMAQHDQFVWNTLNSILLPAGKGEVTCAADVCTITVMWDRDALGGNDCSTLTCVQISVQPF